MNSQNLIYRGAFFEHSKIYSIFNGILFLAWSVKYSKLNAGYKLLLRYLDFTIYSIRFTTNKSDKRNIIQYISNSAL